MVFLKDLKNNNKGERQGQPQELNKSRTMMLK